MEVDIKHKPSFATLFVSLAAGESIIAEADAMASMDSEIVLSTRFNGGFFAALLKRIFGGESLFINEFKCPEQTTSANVVLTQPTPGDLTEIQLNGNAMFVQPGGFVACTPGVKLGLGWAGFASWFGGEGLFRLKVSGHGTVWVGAYGGIFEREIKDEYIVDTGHLVAYEPTVSLSVALSGGLFSSLFGGEGFVTRAKGPGKIYLQTRSMEGLVNWTNAHI